MEMDEEARRKVAVEIADALGETGGPGQAPRERVKRQLARMIEVMGEEWVRDTLAETEQYRGLETLGHNFRKDGVNRTDGGSFFATARASGYRLAERGEIAWPDFYRTFCWRERKSREPRAPKPPPAPQPKRERRPPVPRQPTAARAWGQGVRRNHPAVEPEVVVTRRAAR